MVGTLPQAMIFIVDSPQAGGETGSAHTFVRYHWRRNQLLPLFGKA